MAAMAACILTCQSEIRTYDGGDASSTLLRNGAVLSSAGRGPTVNLWDLCSALMVSLKVNPTADEAIKLLVISDGNLTNIQA